MNLSHKHTRVLEQLGLSPIQVKLYLAALKLGMPTVIELAKAVSVSRQKVYDEAEQLVRLGLLDVNRKKRRKYIPAKPEYLLKLGQRHVADANAMFSGLSNLIPALEQSALHQKRKHAVTVKYYEGIDRVRKAYLDVLENTHATELLSLGGSLEDIFKFFPFKFWERWNRKLAHNNNSARMIVHDSRLASKFVDFEKYHIETRTISPFPLKTDISVFNDTVLDVSYYDELALWIESRIIADSYRTLFHTLWNIAKPLSKR